MKEGRVLKEGRILKKYIREKALNPSRLSNAKKRKYDGSWDRPTCMAFSSHEMVSMAEYDGMSVGVGMNRGMYAVLFSGMSGWGIIQPRWLQH